MLPKTCNCFQNITAIGQFNQTKKINRWFDNRVFCLKYSQNTTTLNYLATITKTCDMEQRCQNYFCKVDGRCPIVDIYIDQRETVRDGIYKYSSSAFNLRSSSIYNTSISSKEEFENKILLPAIDISISFNGKCIDGDNSINFNYPLINDKVCAIDQSYYTIFKSPVNTVLNANDNYFESINKNFPLFDFVVNDQTKFNLDISYAFYRESLRCFLEKFDTLNEKRPLPGFTYVESTDTLVIKRNKLKALLRSFVQFDSSYEFQNYIQLAILIVNCFIVGINVMVISAKIIIYSCSCCSWFSPFIVCEKYLCFFLDLGLAVLGGVSYFILIDYVDVIDNMLDQNCVDNYVQYKFGVFSDNLEATAEANLQLFIIMIIKIFMIVFTILYYISCSKCNIECKRFGEIVAEGINDGDDDILIKEINSVRNSKTVN